MFKKFFENKRELKPLLIIATELLFIVLILFFGLNTNNKISSFISPIPSWFMVNKKVTHEVFGFAPHWTIDKLDNVDFSTLTTLAYFGIPINGDGTLDKYDGGYDVFKSDKATEIFNKAHRNGTKVVLTLTQMDNYAIESLMDSPEAQKITIEQSVYEVKQRGINGINVDIEYVGDPGDEYRKKFTKFTTDLSKKLHSEVPNANLTVSVYASAVRYPKIYDIAALSKVTDGIFMMAYDFAVKGSDNAIPTSPLYGHKEGKYWYDISTAVDDFLAVMPADKLILGLPWYGYDYPVYEPAVNAETHRGSSYWYKQQLGYGRWAWRSGYSPIPSLVQTYKNGSDEIKATKTGWDDLGKVGWKAYQEDGTWRMFFLEDQKSLGLKYDFAKQKELLGVGMWALGFDEGKGEMWSLLREKFGQRLARGEN